MATILTVHGTGATGPETGEQWWQKGSEFEGRMRRLVEPEEGDAGELNFQPVIWDGANSETSRRATGTELCGKMNELEARGEPYSIIGHSHGGSVISAALINHAGKRCTLDHLKSWITVGTPFIQSRKERFLFLRLGVIGKVTFGVLLLLNLVFALPFVIPVTTGYIGQGVMNGLNAITFFFLVLFIIVMFIPIIAFYLAARRMERGNMHRYDGAAKSFLIKEFRPRFVSLWHRDDEAIQGLGALKLLSFDIFETNFAVRGIKVISFLIVPALCAILVFSPGLMKDLFDTLKPMYYRTFANAKVYEGSNKIGEKHRSIKIGVSVERQLPENGKDVGVNIVTAAKLFYGVLEYAACKMTSNFIKCDDANRQGITIGFATLLALVFFKVLSYSGGWVSRLISTGFSRMLNPIARGQIRASAFGSDAEEGTAVDARAWPMWMERGQPALPDELANEIQVHADKAAALAIPKFRNAARLFASSRDDANPASTGSKNASSTDMLSDYLTWDELIHTSYFTNQRFCKLVAYALTQNGGLRASAAFKADPDYALVAKWHKGLVAGNGSELSAT